MNLKGEQRLKIPLDLEYDLGLIEKQLKRLEDLTPVIPPRITVEFYLDIEVARLRRRLEARFSHEHAEQAGAISTSRKDADHNRP